MKPRQRLLLDQALARKAPPPAIDEAIERDEALIGQAAVELHVERQMQSLLVELSEMSRQISAQLDTRSAKLELLIKEAD